MKLSRLDRTSLLLACALLACDVQSQAQTRLRLSSIIPGSEQVQLLPNGDFQFQGALSGSDYPSPRDWN